MCQGLNDPFRFHIRLAINLLMDHRYDRANEFKAKAQFFFGSILCTPFCLGFSNWLTGEFEPQVYQIKAAAILLAPGVYFINNSYGIMKKRDENHVRFH